MNALLRYTAYLIIMGSLMAGIYAVLAASILGH